MSDLWSDSFSLLSRIDSCNAFSSLFLLARDEDDSNDEDRNFKIDEEFDESWFDRTERYVDSLNVAQLFLYVYSEHTLTNIALCKSCDHENEFTREFEFVEEIDVTLYVRESSQNRLRCRRAIRSLFVVTSRDIELDARERFCVDDELSNHWRFFCFFSIEFLGLNNQTTSLITILSSSLKRLFD